MNIAIQRAAGAVLAFAMLPLAAGAANAGEMRLTVGDLSQPDQAAAFSQRLDAMSKSLCDNDIRDLVATRQRAQCRKDVRAEVMDELNRDQREQLAAVAARQGTGSGQ